MTNKDNSQGFATKAVRTGQLRGSEQEHSEPIYTTSSFVFDSAEQAAARFSYQEEGNVYSRFTNPTVRAFEERLAALEEAESCVGTSSGMAAIMTVCMTALQAGDHIVVSSSIFGATKVLFSQVMGKFGVEITYVSLTRLEEWEQALKTNTKLVFFETPTNPLMEIGDIEAISKVVHTYDASIKVVVDNCFCTPVLQQPLTLGADVVIHSATKFIDGQGRCVGGAIVGDKEFVGNDVFAFLRTAGPSLSPFNAWVFLKGLETMPLRVNHACDSAMKLAQWLESKASVSNVYYPGLASHPQFELAAKQQKKAGALVTFEMAKGQRAAFDLINNTKMLSITANLGDTRTTITNPATTTHARWSDEDKQAAGIVNGLVRISVGLEDIEDIIADLKL